MNPLLGLTEYLQKLERNFRLLAYSRGAAMIGGAALIFTVILVGMLTKRVPPVAAKAGLLFFIVCYGLTQTVFPVRLHFLHVLAILFVLTALLMLAMGRLWPMAEPYRTSTNNVVALTPWKNRHLYAVLLLAAMVVLFLIFSPVGLAK